MPKPTLDEIKARRDAATKGPWIVERTATNNWIGPSQPLPSSKVNEVVFYNDREGLKTSAIIQHDNDAKFIAHAPEDITWLIAELEKAREDVKRLEKRPDLDSADVKEILSLMVFNTGPTAHILRDSGAHTIPHKTEEEQFYVFKWLLEIQSQVGSEWRKSAQDYLHQMKSTAIDRAAGGGE